MAKTNFEFITESEDILAQVMASAFINGIEFTIKNGTDAGKDYINNYIAIRCLIDEYKKTLREIKYDYYGVVDQGGEIVWQIIVIEK